MAGERTAGPRRHVPPVPGRYPAPAGARRLGRGPAHAAAALLPLVALGACVEPPRPAGASRPLFSVVCTSGNGGEPTTAMVAARTITVAPGPRGGTELSWAGEAPGGGEPVRVQLSPGQHCVIYRTI